MLKPPAPPASAFEVHLPPDEVGRGCEPADVGVESDRRHGPQSYRVRPMALLRTPFSGTSDIHEHSLAMRPVILPHDVIALQLCDNQPPRPSGICLVRGILLGVELLKIVPTDVPGTLRLVGELDISNVESVQARLEEEFADNGQLSLDTSELTFMDSQGIRMLIMLGEQALAQESAIVILNCSKAVRRSLDVSIPKGIPGVELVKTDT